MNKIKKIIIIIVLLVVIILAGMKVYSLKDVCQFLKIGPKKGLELFNNNE